MIDDIIMSKQLSLWLLTSVMSSWCLLLTISKAIFIVNNLNGSWRDLRIHPYLYPRQLFGIPRAKVRVGVRGGMFLHVDLEIKRQLGGTYDWIVKPLGFQVWDFQRGQTRVWMHKWTDDTSDDCRKQGKRQDWKSRQVHSFTEENGKKIELFIGLLRAFQVD